MNLAQEEIAIEKEGLQVWSGDETVVDDDSDELVPKVQEIQVGCCT